MRIRKCSIRGGSEPSPVTFRRILRTGLLQDGHLHQVQALDLNFRPEDHAAEVGLQTLGLLSGDVQQDAVVQSSDPELVFHVALHVQDETKGGLARLDGVDLLADQIVEPGLGLLTVDPQGDAVEAVDEAGRAICDGVLLTKGVPVVPGDRVGLVLIGRAGAGDVAQQGRAGGGHEGKTTFLRSLVTPMLVGNRHGDRPGHILKMDPGFSLAPPRVLPSARRGLAGC